jgi:hypothetical protein
VMRKISCRYFCANLGSLYSDKYFIAASN